VIGFLFGFSLASSFAAYRLLDEYKEASAALQASVEELQKSTEKARRYFTFDRRFLMFLQVSEHVRRIESVEKDLKALSNSSASKDELSRLRAEVKKIYDGLHIGEYILKACLLISDLLARISGPADICVGTPYVFILYFVPQH
jgi:hypothetical protein